MKEFRRKHEYKIYIFGAVLIALFAVTATMRSVNLKTQILPNSPVFNERDGIGSGDMNMSTNTELVHAVQQLVPASDIFFQKEVQGVYDAYAPEKLKLARDHKVILFFKADWCPSCQIADETLNKEFASIPKNIAILKVSYDNELELRRKYGVTLQHTFVQVDEQGNMITKWLGSTSIGEILKQVK